MARARRIVKWGGLVLCVVIVAAWGLSTVCDVVYRPRSCRVSLTAGAARVDVAPYAARTPYIRRRLGRGLFWLPFHNRWPDLVESPVHVVLVPLWLPFLFTAVPTVIAWRRDRRPKPDHCACGYNLEGNVSGKCPECGTKVEVER